MISDKTKNSESARFMLIDDDDISIMAIERAIKQLNITNSVEVAKDGVEALQLLQTAVVGGVLPPYVLTLDLNMPKMGGLEFLERIRNNQVLSKLVVFVLTTSDAPSDIASAYAHNVAGYIVKEDPANTYKEALALLRDYSNLVRLPC